MKLNKIIKSYNKNLNNINLIFENLDLHFFISIMVYYFRLTLININYINTIGNMIFLIDVYFRRRVLSY